MPTTGSAADASTQPQLARTTRLSTMMIANCWINSNEKAEADMMKNLKSWVNTQEKRWALPCRKYRRWVKPVKWALLSQVRWKTAILNIPELNRSGTLWIKHSLVEACSKARARWVRPPSLITARWLLNHTPCNRTLSLKTRKVAKMKTHMVKAITAVITIVALSRKISSTNHHSTWTINATLKVALNYQEQIRWARTAGIMQAQA